VIAFQNGLLDLDKFIEGEVILHPHTDSWLSANCLPYNFNPDATCPLITSTLLHNLGDDESQLLLLEQFAGYSMTTDNSFHKILMLLGETRAGKGLCLELMRAIVGGDNCADIDLTSLLGEFGLAPLVGKQLAIIDEAGNSSKTDRDAVVRMLKRVSGGNRFSINEKFKPKQANVELYSKTVMAMNELPLGLDPSGALAGRALILSFPNSHLDCEDVELKDKLTVQSEIEGWAYRCLIGYRELKKHHRFIETAQSQRLRREFNQHNSPAACFVEDCLLVSKEYAPAVIDAGNVVDGPLSIHRDDLKLVILAYDGFGKQTDITWRLKFLWAVLKKCKPENRYQKIINGIALKPEARKWVDCAIDYYQNRGDGKMSDLVYVPVVSKADFEKSFYHR
jgi:putative DNA primase/helicase